MLEDPCIPSVTEVTYPSKGLINHALLEPGLPRGDIVSVMRNLSKEIKDKDMQKRWEDIAKVDTLGEIAGFYEVSTYRIKALIKRDLRIALDHIK